MDKNFLKIKNIFTRNIADKMREYRSRCMGRNILFRQLKFQLFMIDDLRSK